jgi:hypothetical protein
MNYLTQHYKNLCEKYSYQIKTLEKKLNEYKELPVGGGETPELIDTPPVTQTKKEDLPNNNDPSTWPYITAQNWQQIYNMILQWRGNVPSWFQHGFWGGADTQYSIEYQWENFINFLLGAVQRAGSGNPINYWYVQEKWNEYTSSVLGSPYPFPLRYQAQYF